MSLDSRGVRERDVGRVVREGTSREKAVFSAMRIEGRDEIVPRRVMVLVRVSGGGG